MSHCYWFISFLAVLLLVLFTTISYYVLELPSFSYCSVIVVIQNEYTMDDFLVDSWSAYVQLWHHFRIFWGYIWSGKRIWTFPSGNMWSLHWNWSKNGLQKEDMFYLWWEGSSYENRADTFWLVFSGNFGFLVSLSLLIFCFVWEVHLHIFKKKSTVG